MRVSLWRKSGRLALIVLAFNISLYEKTDAQFASQFTLTVGEEYNDNIFFEKQKEHDFITQITPTFSVLFQPFGAAAPALTLDVSPTGQIYARHPKENNFGRNLGLTGTYTHRWSPALTFHVADSLQTQGQTRTVGVRDPRIFAPGTSTSPPVPGLGPSQNVGSLISNGDTLSNNLVAQANYVVGPNVTVSGTYANAYSKFLDLGGSEVSHDMGFKGIYHWRQEHNLYAGYRVNLLRPRHGGNSVIHSFDIGDDYFSNRVIRLTPTLTLSASTGISVNAGSNGPRIVNNTTAALIKIWETASFAAGLQKGLTNSFGVSGVSDTLTVFSTYDIRLSETLSTRASIDYSRFDTDDADFNTLQTAVDLQYAITNWLCSGLRYSHRRLVGGHGARNTNLQTGGNIYGNSVFLTVSAHFDVWPNLGRSRVRGCSGVLPIITPQLPQSSKR